MLKIPFMSFVIITTLVTTGVLSAWKVKGVENLYLESEKVIQNYQVWRILSSWMYETNFIVLLIILYDMFRFLTKFELRNSTPVLLNDFLIYSAFFAIVFTGISIFCYLVLPNKPQLSLSVLCIWINFLFKYSYSSPPSSKTSILFLIPILWKIYPWIIYILCCLASQEVRVDGLLGILSAVIECVFFKSGFILFTLDTYIDKEWYANLIRLPSLSCWVKVDGNQIKQNQRLTVNSCQFYEKAHLDEEVLRNEEREEEKTFSTMIKMEEETID